MVQQQFNLWAVAIKGAAVLTGIDTDAFHEAIMMLEMALPPRARDDAAPARMTLPAQPAGTVQGSQRHAGPLQERGMLEHAGCQSGPDGVPCNTGYNNVDNDETNNVVFMTAVNNDDEEGSRRRALSPRICALERDVATSTDSDANGDSGHKTGNAGGSKVTASTQTNASDFDLQRCEHDARYQEWRIEVSEVENA